MRSMLVIATLAAIAAAAFGAAATRGRSGALTTSDDRGGVGGALSLRAYAIAPARGHALALRAAFLHAHPGTRASTPRRVREATHQRVLWALATFALSDGTVVSERFSWRRGQGWRDLGATRAACPTVPPEVRSAWRLTACG